MKIFIFLFLFSIFNISFGQNNRPDKRIELAVHNVDNSRFLFIDETYVIYEGYNLQGKFTEIKIYDADLESVFEKKIQFNENHQLLKVNRVENDIYLTFSPRLGYSIQEKDIKLFGISLNSGESDWISIGNFTIPNKKKLANVKPFIQDNTLIFSGYLSSGLGYKGTTCLYQSDLESLDGKFWTIDNKALNLMRITCNKITKNSVSDEFLFDLNGIMRNAQYKNFVIRKSTNGKKLSCLNLESQLSLLTKGKILSHSSIYISDSTFVNTAAYITYRNKNILFNSKHAEGILITKVTGNKIHFSKMIDFKDLESIRNRNKTEILGKDVLSHDLLKIEDKYYYLAEIYTPKYTNHNSSNKPRLAGYSFKEIVLICFDLNGTVLWDKAFKLESVYQKITPSRSPSHVTSLRQSSINKNRITISYLNGFSKNILSSSNNLLLEFDLSGNQTNKFGVKLGVDTKDLRVCTKFWSNGDYFVFGDIDDKTSRRKVLKNNSNTLFINVYHQK